jgi:hypothetical protein
MKLDIQKYAFLGFFVALASLVVTYLMTTFLKVIPQSLFSTIPATTGLNQNLAVNVLKWLSGITGLSLSIGSVYVLLFISAFLIVAVGSALVDLFNWKADNDWGKLLLVLLVGTALWYVIMIGFNWIGISAVIGLLVYYGATSFVGLAVAKIAKKDVI